MITIILNYYNKHTEADMPAMYNELQLALWKLGLDWVPEKYTLQELEVTFHYRSPLEYFVLWLMEGEMNLLDEVSAIYTVIAPARPIMARMQILPRGFRSISYAHTYFFPDNAYASLQITGVQYVIDRDSEQNRLCQKCLDSINDLWFTDQPPVKYAIISFEDRTIRPLLNSHS